MNTLLAITPAILAGAALGTATYANHRLRVCWFFALRRERILVDLVGRGSILLGQEQPDLHDFAQLWNTSMIALFDELHNQQRHRGRVWTKIPDTDQPWPDFEPAPLVMEDK